MGEKGKRQTQTGTSKPKPRGRLVHNFKHMFSVFKQHYMHFHTLFHPHVFSHMFLNNKTYIFKCMYQTPPKYPELGKQTNTDQLR